MKLKCLKKLRCHWRLWRICRKLGINPYPWQRDFALGLTDQLEYPLGRRTGKTAAVLLRLMVAACDEVSCSDVMKILHCDPDFSVSPERADWYAREYARMADQCDCPYWNIRLLAMRERNEHT